MKKLKKGLLWQGPTIKQNNDVTGVLIGYSSALSSPKGNRDVENAIEDNLYGGEGGLNQRRNFVGNPGARTTRKRGQRPFVFIQSTN